VIAKSYILENLRSLDYRYRKADSAKEALFCSKLAILELCGWIEESMDDVIRRCATRRLNEHDNRDFCEHEIIRRNYGFEYQINFRSMLIRLLGLVAVEKLEKKVDQTLYASMTATLSSLKITRNAEAHTHLKGTTRILNAPSVTIGQFRTLYDGLTEFERKIKAMKL
jgi:hypothetical protein